MKMRMLMIACVVLAGCTPPAAIGEPELRLADQMSVAVERTRVNAVELPEASVAVHSYAGESANVEVRCTFYDAGGVALANGRTSVRNVRPGATARGDVMSSTRLERFESVMCDVEDAWRA